MSVSSSSSSSPRHVWLGSLPSPFPQNTAGGGDVGGDGNGQPRIQAWNERGAGSGIEGGKFWVGLGWGPSVGGTARWEKTSGKINQQLLLFLPFPFSPSRSKTNLEKFPAQREGGGNCSSTLARHNNGPKLLCPQPPSKMGATEQQRDATAIQKDLQAKEKGLEGDIRQVCIRRSQGEAATGNRLKRGRSEGELAK